LLSQFIIAKRKQALAYNDKHLKFGFNSVVVNCEIRPQFVLSLEVLANGSLREAKLRRHLEQKYAKYVYENLELFKEKKNTR